MEKTDITIIGSGVIGLAMASQIGQEDRDIIVVERHPTFGQETSSRNSEVIHSGLYYPQGSLKAKLCIEGNRLLYQFCGERNIAHKQMGKLIVATNDKEIKDLEKLFSQGRNNGLEDLRLLTEDETKKIEPHIKVVAALHSPSAGIIDTHQLMNCLESSAKDKGVIFAYNCEVTGLKKKKAGYEISIRDADGQKLTLFTRLLINSAGLHSDKVAQMVGIDIEKAGYKLLWSKGEYFRVKGNKSKFINHLIYPTPEDSSLGIHTVQDLQGQLRLGPNAFYVEEIGYDVEPAHITEFYESAKRFLPFIEIDDLSPDMAGIRPKLQTPGKLAEDFVISYEDEKGFPGLINLMGIDSPGLTASLAMARHIDGMMLKHGLLR